MAKMALELAEGFGANVDSLETKYRFVRYVEKTESKPIFFGRG